VTLLEVSSWAGRRSRPLADTAVAGERERAFLIPRLPWLAGAWCGVSVSQVWLNRKWLHPGQREAGGVEAR
jgi:hypothetical protein